MSLNDKASAALKREIRRAFPERGENDAGHDRLAEALTEGGMYAVRVKHDTGTSIIRTYANDAETAARVVCKVEGCPRSAILSVARSTGGAA